MDSSIIYKLADIEAVLNHLNEKVSHLETTKNTINLLQQKYPDLKYNHKYYTSASVKDEITGMELKRKYKSSVIGRTTYFITAKFYVNPSLNYGSKIYLAPLENVIAEHYVGTTYNNKSDTITIFDFSKFIDKEWYRSNQFIKRTRHYLLKYIEEERATITDQSYEKSYFEGLLALQ